MDDQDGGRSELSVAPRSFEQKRLSRAALETLAIVAYHQPVTRAEIEDIRGVAISKGTLDMLMEIGWVKMRGRKRTPGRPVTYGTTESFLRHFGLNELLDLPGLLELKGAGLSMPICRPISTFRNRASAVIWQRTKSPSMTLQTSRRPWRWTCRRRTVGFGCAEEELSYASHPIAASSGESREIPLIRQWPKLDPDFRRGDDGGSGPEYCSGSRHDG